MAESSRMQQQQKEKQKEKQEKEKEGKKFYSTFFPEKNAERLTIPPLFNQFLGNDPTGVVSLKPQSGNTWIVELSSDTQGFFFGNGWKEFVADHSLEMGDVLTFRYDGHSKFSVVVFDGKCSEKPSALHAKPHKDMVIEPENNEGDHKHMNATDCHAKPGKDEVIKLEEDEQSIEMKKDDSDAEPSKDVKPEDDEMEMEKDITPAVVTEEISNESARRRKSKETDFFF